MNWMQQPVYAPILLPVNRVIVHLQQVSSQNKYSKLFAIEMGWLLQQLCNVQTCVIKLSQPHIHRATGPMFKLGDSIVQACQLTQQSSPLSLRLLERDLLIPILCIHLQNGLQTIVPAVHQMLNQTRVKTKGRKVSMQHTQLSTAGRRKCLAPYFVISFTLTLLRRWIYKWISLRIFRNIGKN